MLWNNKALPVKPYKSLENTTVKSPPRDVIGKPAPKPLFSLKDLRTLALVVVCLVAAVATVTATNIAFQLGQINQLAALGFLLAVLGLYSQRKIQTLLLTLDPRHGISTLQKFDAILRNDALAEGVTY